ncbi:MAG: hypothetical protein ABI378_07650 [Chitinophagaceae bacterium]
MRVTITRLFLLSILVAGLLPTAKAQMNLPGFLKNYEIGYGASFTWADYSRTLKAVSEGGQSYDTTVTTRVKSKHGLSATTGTSINLKRLGEKSQLALGLSGIYNLYTWDYATANGARLTDSGVVYDYSYGTTFGGATLNAGLAISADFKFGAEAMMDKQYRLSWTGGIGVYPSVNLTADIDNTNMTFGVQPFVKTEFGIRGPIAAKLRLMYAFGNLTYIDATDKNNFFGLQGAQNNTKLIGKGNFTVSLILLPFSWNYKTSHWYNSY